MSDHTTHTGTLPDGPQLLVETWEGGLVTVATRDHFWETWSPPVVLTQALEVSA